MGTPHKWAKEIHAWADGAEIEYRQPLRTATTELGWSDWVQTNNPAWALEGLEFRVKPKPIVRYVGVSELVLSFGGEDTLEDYNKRREHKKSGSLGPVRLEIDPDTKRILKAEVV